MTARLALAARERLPLRALMLAALLSLLLGAALSQLLRSSEGGAPAPAAVGASGSSAAALSWLAPAARASISAALGADDPAYHFGVAAGGLQAANPAQHLSISVGRSQTLVRSHGVDLGLGLLAVGYGDSLQAVRAVQPRGVANRATYAHGVVSEWYVNGPLGLEQGFTVAQAPAQPVAGPLTLAISLSGDTHAALAAGGQSVTFDGLHGGALRYGGLRVSDAGGRPLHSWLALDGRQLLLRVDARGARFPLRIDPLVKIGRTEPHAGGQGRPSDRRKRTRWPERGALRRRRNSARGRARR